MLELGPPVVLVLDVPAAAAAVGGVEGVSAEPGLDWPRPRPRRGLASLLR